ncbi:MAG TPA: hypothetical protein VMH03_19525 [Terriglobales bacterium]|nr:hypothetical protein [Terriglobales bacterium]
MHCVINVAGVDIRIEGRLLRLARLERQRYEGLSDPEAVIAGLRQCGRRVDLFTFMQRLPEVQPRYSYPMEWDNLAVLPISTFDHWWKKQVDAKTRNMVRKAEKQGVKLREVPFGDALVKGIWEIYNETPYRQGKRFPHYGKDIETVYKEEATHLDRSVFIGAFLGEEMIGFIKLVEDDTRTETSLINIVSLIRHRDKAPTNTLIASAVRACADRRIPYLVYSKFAYGKRQRDTLSDFKKNNGFERVDLPRYYVALTLTGWSAFRLGLHHRAFEFVPGSIVTKFRELRAAWNSRKARPMVEAS